MQFDKIELLNMEERKLRDKILKEYKNWSIFGTPEVHGDWYYYWILKGNNKKVIRWNIKTDEHEDIMTVNN